MSILQNIFSDHFHKLLNSNIKIRDTVIESVNFTPGFICVLHTFGRSLQWNPHIHMLISEGASGNFSV